MINLSVLIIVCNEEKQLKECLETVKFADEIVIILDKCKDKSKIIAKKYTNKIYEGSWDIEGNRRNYGIQNVMVNGFLRLMQMKEYPKI